MQAAKKAQRRERKDIYAALQKEHTEREAELANKYRDRAAERRDGKEDSDMMGSMGMGSKFTGLIIKDKVLGETNVIFILYLVVDRVWA